MRRNMRTPALRRDVVLLALAALLAALSARAWQDPIEAFVPSEQVPADSAVAFPVDI